MKLSPVGKVLIGFVVLAGILVAAWSMMQGQKASQEAAAAAAKLKESRPMTRSQTPAPPAAESPAPVGDAAAGS
ncbi:MAG: hypothetical protein ACREJQ_09065 [bacterium]